MNPLQIATQSSLMVFMVFSAVLKLFAVWICQGADLETPRTGRCRFAHSLGLMLKASRPRSSRNLPENRSTMAILTLVCGPFVVHWSLSG